MSVIQIEKNKERKIQQTFQILRSISQIQRKLLVVQNDLKALSIENIKSLQQIQRHLNPFTNQAQYKSRSHQHLIRLEMILSWKYLKIPPTPFLPSISPNFKYTLVIDLDQTLIYFNQENNMLKYRPFMDTFLNTVKQCYELIMFTASSKDYADVLIKQIEAGKKMFDYCLYKQHLSLYNGRMIKDIGRIGRDLSKTIIIDNLKINFSNYPRNGIQISTWVGNKKDRHLIQLLPKIMNIAKMNIEDIRLYLDEQKKTLEHIAQDTQEQQCTISR